MIKGREMLPSPNGTERINSFALVTYVPEPLGSFLDRLRQEIVPSQVVYRAHVTILPPRPLTEPPEAVWATLLSKFRHLAPFMIEATDVNCFEMTSVIYLGVGGGWRELEYMHGLLNIDGLAFAEPHPYHPHITLAQGLLPSELTEVKDFARRKWAECHLSKWFPGEMLTFVQNTSQNEWVDLAHFTLKPLASMR
jgi:2'-5' RNA ligase